MRKESFQGILLGIVIMCAVFAFITVAWAALSSTLTINGTATVAASSWKVEFSDTANALMGSTGVTCTSTNSNALCPVSLPTLTTSAFGGSYSSPSNLGTLNTVGDTITYSWYIANDGSFDAYINGVTGVDNEGNVSITCTADGVDSTEQGIIDTFCSNAIKATLKVNNQAPSSYTKIDKKTGSTTTIPVVLEIKYDSLENVTTLPGEAVTVKLNSGSAGISMTYSQATTTTANP